MNEHGGSSNTNHRVAPPVKLSVTGLSVHKTFGSQERIVPMGNFRSRDFSFSRTFVPGERKFRGTFVPSNFRSQELSFLPLFYKALVMNHRQL